MFNFNTFKKNQVFTPESLIKERLTWMNFGGVNPKDRRFWKKFVCWFYLIGSGTITLLMIPEMFISKNHSVGTLAEDFLMGFGFLQMFAKSLVCYTQAEILNEMIDDIWYKFWDLESTEDGRKKKYRHYYRIADITSKMYGFNVMFSGTAFVISATLKAPYSLVMEIWLPYRNILKMSPYYEFVYVIETYLLYSVCLFLLIPLDSLFILMVAFVCVQFKLIKDRVRKISGREEDYEEIVHCVEHHNLLLRFISKMESVYSKINLLSLGSNLFLTTLSLYAVVKETDMSRKFSFMCVYLSVFSQLSFYCIAGQLIQTESATLATAAYDSQWYLCDDKRVIKALIMMIRRSQTVSSITMGGYVNLCLETLTNYCRATFSFLTFIINIRHTKEDQ